MWRARVLEAQHRILQQHVQSPIQTFSVPINTSGDVMNVLDSHPKDHTRPTLVLMHGYGMGLPCWFANIDPFIRHGYRVVAMDWLGMGASSRPPFPSCSALPFFLHAFHNALDELNISQAHLLGHSLGGYLVGQYALEHPERCQSVILASPVGLTILPPSNWHWFHLLWYGNITPQRIVRWMGLRGKTMMERFVGARMDQVLADYFYHMTMAPGSGEFALGALLQPVITKDFAIVGAKKPLEGSELTMPNLILFGDRDWLCPPRVEEVCARNPQTTLQILPQSGHHLYLDNAKAFHQAVVQFLDAQERK